MLQAGDADSIFAPQMYFPQLQNIPGVQVIDKQQNLEIGPFMFFAYHVNPAGNQNIGSGKLDGEGAPPDFFSDKDVRKGFAYLLDSDAYVRDVQRGKGHPATSLFPEGMLGYRGGKQAYRYDPKRAEAHFRKAWGGKLWDAGFKTTIAYVAGSAPAETQCRMLKRSVEALNPKFRLDVRVLQWSTFLEQSQQRKIPLFAGMWGADYPDPHNFAFALLHSAGYYATQQGFKNPEMDALIEKAVHSGDEAERARLYARLQKLWDEEVPSVPVADGWRYRAQRTWVHGYVHNPIFPDSPYSDYYYDISKGE
jgi:peptide/nickel transport system substrate-binding protein